MRVRFIGIFFAVFCALLSACSSVATDNDTFSKMLPVTKNFLKEKHENGLAAARLDGLKATSALEKGLAMQRQAAALDSLGRSKEAMALINEALGIVDERRREGLLVTKSTILFSAGDPSGSLDILRPIIEKHKRISENAPEGAVFYLSGHTSAFVIAVFSYMELGQWKNAVDTLADTYALQEGPGFFSYQSLLYRLIMARAADSSLANPALEGRASKGALSDKSHYGALLRMWQGESNARELGTIYFLKPSSTQQDALAEILFFRSAYAKYVRRDEAGGKLIWEKLVRLAPYGSVEWVYGRRALQLTSN